MKVPRITILLAFFLGFLLVLSALGLILSDNSSPAVTIQIPKNAHDPSQGLSLIVEKKAHVPVVDGRHVLSLKQNPVIRIVNNVDLSFFVAIQIDRVIYFPNGTTWGETIFESPPLKHGETLTFEFDKPGDYEVYAIPWPWTGSVSLRVIP